MLGKRAGWRRLCDVEPFPSPNLAQIYWLGKLSGRQMGKIMKIRWAEAAAQDPPFLS